MILSRASFKQTKFTASQIQVAKTPLATFESNVSGLYIPEILAYIQATQAGTGDPSPINPRAINGVTQVDTTRTGVNLCGGIDLANQIKKAIPDAVIDTTEKTVTFATNATATGGLVVLPFKEDTRYTIILTFEKTNASGSLNAGFRWYYTDGNGGYTLEAPDYQTKTTQVATSKPNGTVLRINKVNTGGVTKVYYDESGIFEGTLTASDFVPYTGTTATTALGGTYYGGYVNVPTGLMMVTHEQVDLGDVSWRFNADMGVFYTSDIKGNKTPVEFICSEYATNMTNVSLSNLPDLSGVLRTAALYIRDNSYEGRVNAFTTGVTGVKLVYPLATPITVQLTPAQIEQLLGQNNVFCSTGDVAVKYWKID